MVDHRLDWGGLISVALPGKDLAVSRLSRMRNGFDHTSTTRDFLTAYFLYGIGVEHFEGGRMLCTHAEECIVDQGKSIEDEGVELVANTELRVGAD